MSTDNLKSATTTKAPAQGVATPSTTPTVGWTALRFVGSKKPVPETTDGGRTWVLPFIPRVKTEVEIPPKTSVELETGVKLVVPEGHEVHVSHVLYHGRPGHLRPCLIVSACEPDKATEVRVPVVNITNETMRLTPGQTLAYFHLVPLRKCGVEKT